MKYSSDNSQYWRRRLLQWTVFGAIILLAALLQATPSALPRPWGIAALPLPFTAVGLAMIVGPVGGAGAGIACGLLWDVYTDTTFGYHALLLMIVGCACGLLVQWILRNNLLTYLMLTAITLFGITLLDWILHSLVWSAEGAWTLLFRVYLPSAVYSVLLCPLMYLLIHFINKRLPYSYKT